MDSEKEIWSRISETDYKRFLDILGAKFGTSKVTKRIAIQATDYNRQDLDTRVRITNGKAKIMQKKGGWKDETRIEISTPLGTEPETVYNAYRTIRNLLPGDNVETSIIQTENTLFQNEEYEIKLTHQSGKTDVYNYEIEVFDHSLNPTDIVKEMSIPIDSPESTPEFWKEWNSKVNLMADSLSEEEMLELIKKYL